MFRSGSALALALVALLPLLSATPIKQLEFPVNDVVSRADDPLYRLPNDTYPIHYKVHLDTRIDQDDFMFTGNVEINLGVEKETNQITMHARNMTVESVALYRDATPHVPVAVTGTAYDDVTELFTIFTEAPVTVGNTYTLIIDYWSELREDNAGFYQAWYDNAEGKRV